MKLPHNIDRDRFLQNYWQKKPLLMRGALEPDEFPLEPEELAGLACEPEFESRLVIEHGTAEWELRHGPLAESDFAALPATNWSLLVQDVDKFVPEVADLLDHFGFVPSWRIDDIMVSYATDQGGVGPHTDAYDVFLMQAHGRRRWRLSYREYDDNDLVPDLDLRILSHFETDEDWVLEPGDVLYLPPGVAHWGTAEGDCMTYSLGFRAPDQQELAADWFQHRVSLAGDSRLRDPKDLRGAHPGELTAGGVAAAAGLLSELPDEHSPHFKAWLGAYLTEPKPQFQIEPSEPPWSTAQLRDWLGAGKSLVRHPFARLCWSNDGPESIMLFHNGESLTLPASITALVRQLTGTRHLDASQLVGLAAQAEAIDALLSLINLGILEPGENR